MFIGKYDLLGQGRNKIISYGQYHNHSPVNISPQNPIKLPENKIELSTENRKKADELTKLTLQMFNIQTNNQELEKDTKNIKAGLDYFI